MRITGIKINHFRQYDSLFLDFTKKSAHDLHIIVADNGVGKTNILNAITWCLYEEEPHLGDKSKSLPRMNLQSKGIALANGETSVIVSVVITAEDSGETLEFVRKMSVNAETDFEAKSELTIAVYRDTGTNIYADELAKSYVDKYMPLKIRQYFYFDGEQLDSYFISDESSKIKETIHAISHIDIVTRVKDRLTRVINNKQTEAGKKDPNIKVLNDELACLEPEIDSIKREIQTLDIQISKSQTVIQTNAEILQGQENLPELEGRFQSLTGQRKDLETQKSECEKELFTFIREMKVALSLYPHARKTLDIILDKEKQNALPPTIDKQLLGRILEGADGDCIICGQSLTEKARLHIEELMSKIQVSSETSNTLMFIRGELERIVAEATDYPVKKDRLLREHRRINESIKICEQELQELDDEINKFSDKEQVIQLHTERKTHTELLELNKGRKAVAAHRLQDAESKKAETSQKLIRALEKEKECAHLNQIIRFASRARDIIDSVEQEMMAESREKMETRTMEYFDQLIWKKDVYKSITLDERYQLDLFHRDGYSCVGSCSAAERSLLALSFTLALHEVSGFNSPLFIDTPVARVASQNRINFANVLKHVSTEKQLIMAFTPDEYSESVRNIFGPAAATSVHLAMNEDNEITGIA